MTVDHARLLLMRLRALCDETLLPHTRMHMMRVQEFPGATLWVKREDETGFGISGFKSRKFASLLPWLQNQTISQAALIGSGNSGNVAGLAQLLIQREIEPVAFLKEGHNESGFYSFLISLLCGSENIRFIPNDEWAEAANIAHAWAEEEKIMGLRTVIIPEGAAMAEAVAGASTLWSDIQENISKENISPDHIFIDSGTGLTAATLACVMGMANEKTKLHVILLAGSEEAFEGMAQQCSHWISQLLQESAPAEMNPAPYQIHIPENGKSFGSVTREVLNEVKRLATQEGILADPVYSGKLFLESGRIIGREKLQGTILLIHSGGAPTLSGFMNRF